jgi:PH domain
MMQREVKSGYLTKIGLSIKSWKKRYFIFDGDILFYFENVTSTRQKGEVSSVPPPHTFYSILQHPPNNTIFASHHNPNHPIPIPIIAKLLHKFINCTIITNYDHGLVYYDNTNIPNYQLV